ncbi:hypothetical protein MNEG_6117, partial [Monoraphidium neglectum]
VTRCGEVYDAPDTPPKQQQPRSPARPSSAPRSTAAAAKLRAGRPLTGSAPGSPAKAAALPAPLLDVGPGALGGLAPSPRPDKPAGARVAQQQQQQQLQQRGRLQASTPTKAAPWSGPPGLGTPGGAATAAAAKISLRRRDDRGAPSSAAGRF